MKRKFLVVLLAIVATFCMAFGFTACGETENSGNTGGGSQTEQPGGSQSGNQGNQGSGGTTKPDEGQGGEEKPDGGQGGNQGGEEKPDKPTEPEKPAEKQIEVKVYIDNVLTETLYTSESKGYKIALPAKPEDTTTDPNLTNYFDGWYADKGYNEPLTGEETYSAPSAIYGRNITSRTYDFSYTVNNGEATIKRFTNSTATTVVVPRYINSFPVTTIGREAFLNKTMLRTVFLCEGLKEIEDSAFYNCNSMQKVVIPSSLTSIGNSAFYDCNSLQSITIPDGVTLIDSFAFWGCRSLQSIVFPKSLKYLGNFIFGHDTPCYFRGSRGDMDYCGAWWDVYSFSYRGTNSVKDPKYLSTVVWEYEG